MILRNKQVLWICLAFLLVPSFAGAVELFSLEKSVGYGLEHSPVMQGVDIQIDQANMDIKAQRGRFLPSVTSGYSHSNVYSISATGITEDDDAIDQNSDVASLRMTQVLFAGFEYKNRFERAKLGKEYQQARLEAQKLDLVYQIKGAFFELLKTRYDVSSITQRVKRLESDLAQAKAFSDKKLAPYVYVLQAEADYEDARQSLWKTETAIDRSEARLKRLLGLPQGTAMGDQIEFNDEFEVPPADLAMDLYQCMDQALKARPEINLVSLQTGMAEKDAAISMGRYYPRVNLDVSLYDSDKDYKDRDRLNQDRDQENRYWTAGISVQWKLFDGGTDYYEKKRHLLEMKRLETEKKQVKLEIEEEVSVSFRSLVEAKKRLTSVEKALLASTENYIRQKKRFSARIGTISELLDGQAMLARAESGKSQALLDCQMALVELQKAMGKGYGVVAQ